MTPDRVEKDVVVSLQYKLWLDDDTLAEESEADDPLVYLHGHDNIIPGLEQALDGLRVGDTKTVVVEPEDGYGEYDPDNADEINRGELPEGFEPEVGMLLSIEDGAGNQLVAEVAEVSEDTILLDFNHPMAGEILRFDVVITGLRQATPEELDHGHVHADDHHHH